MANQLNLFISYSHLDEDYINEFRKHIAPLKNNGLIDDWYDRKIIPGKNFLNTINNNIDNTNIICLFISSNFLASKACMDEKIKSYELMISKGVAVVPIILGLCGWKDDKDIPSHLALPTDGKEVSSFDNSNEAWNDVYNGLKSVIEDEIKIKNLEITESFSSFLQNTDLLTKAHSQKEKVILDDIFVYPELEKYDDLREYEKKESSRLLLQNFCAYSKILLAGENQSGKTTLCKKIFVELREKNLVPVYISDEKNQYLGKIENKITNAFKEQYTGVLIENIDNQKIIPIIDNFHLAKYKEKNIEDLSSYQHQIIIVDDIFSLNFKDDNLLKSFTHFKIKEFVPSLRNKLIEKWTHLTDQKNHITHSENEVYQCIDNTTELVNTALGKIIGSGIMPAYPFFILSVMSTNETFGKPLDQEITSQGYCYQALIYLYLTKQGVKNEEIDTYINFLTQFSFYFFIEKKNELSKDEFELFMKLYLEKFNMPIEQKTLLKKLQQTKLIILDGCNNYSFCYSYIYYFFVAKYIAEHIDESEDIISDIIQNLHKDENSYITLFISHHSKNTYILDELIKNAYGLFEHYKPAQLSDNELSFFDKQVDVIVKEALPATDTTPAQERENRLKNQDLVEQINTDNKNDHLQDNDIAIDIRRSIKTVEVMGLIIKNRAGSMEKVKLESIFEEAMKVHLRILTSFFELIKDDNEEQEFVNFISNRLEKIIETNKIEHNGKIPKKEELEKISKTIFWNISFFIVYSLINKIIHSLGSNKLTDIIKKVCDKENTPVSFLIKHGILMWHNKNIQIDNIAERIDDDDFSSTAKKIMRFMVVNHSSMHLLTFKEKQKIENKLGISSQKLLLKQINKKN